MAQSHFPWPRLAPGEPVPTWTGREFVCGAERSRVLAYHDATSHWSEDLTRMHESEAGRDHSIDLASRRSAVDSMRRIRADRSVYVIDIGCSSGYVLEDLRKALPAANLIGADYLRGPLDGLGRRMPDLPLLQFDLRQCPLPDSCVDGITCLNVLEHIDDDRGAMNHLIRILRPGGIAHIEVPAGPMLYDIYDEHLMHHRRYRLRGLVQLAEAAGFRVRRASHHGFFIYPGFLWIKKRNRGHLGSPRDVKQRLVSDQIRDSRRNPWVVTAMRWESIIGRLFSFPIGIRCVVVLQKS